MALEERRTAALRFLELLPQGRLAEAPLADGFSAWSGVSGDIEGPEYLARCSFLPKIFDGPFLFTIEGTTAEDDRVAVQARSRGRLIDGNDYTNEYHFLFLFVGDRIHKAFEYTNVKKAVELMVPVMRSLREKQTGG